MKKNIKKQNDTLETKPVTSISSKAARKGLVFTPVGGVGEIGGNCYAYGYQDQWIIVDYGIAFPDTDAFGAEVELPDPAFFRNKKDNILAIIVTHAHEDHIGGLSYLWSHFEAPVYATRFAASFLRHKLNDNTQNLRVPIHVLEDQENYIFGDFSVQAIPTSHSIPEARLLAIRVAEQLIVHTGDWSGDPEPLLGGMDQSALTQLAGEGVDFMIGDSTNVLSQSSQYDATTEAKVRDNLKLAIAACSGRVVVTCFASNVARMESIARAGLAAGRQAALIGRSMWRMNSVARDVGYFQDIPAFKDARDLVNLPEKQCLYIVTGSQAEPRAALTRMARGDHPEMRLKPKDTVMYSSREIPGNEKGIAQVHNLLALMGVRVITAEEADVHASGHASGVLMEHFIRTLRPQVVIPVHGEGRHLVAHVALAQKCDVPQALLVHNGDIVQLHKGRAQLVDRVSSGKLAVDGNRFISTQSPIMRERRRIAQQGIISIALAVDEYGVLATDPELDCVGLLEDDDDDTLDQLYLALDNAVKVFTETRLQSKLNKQCEAVEKTMRNEVKKLLGKKPWVKVILLEV